MTDKLIEKGQWKGWYSYNDGEVYQKVFGKNHDIIEAKSGYFGVYKEGKLSGFVGEYPTLKEAIEALNNNS